MLTIPSFEIVRPRSLGAAMDAIAAGSWSPGAPI